MVRSVQFDRGPAGHNGIKSIIEKGKDAVDDIISIATDSEEAKAYTSVAGLMKTLADLNKNTATANQKIVDALASIVKNTALPDYAKEEFGEITKAMMKRKIIEKLSPYG
jgi:peptidyl-tRNA hydrolase